MSGFPLIKGCFEGRCGGAAPLAGTQPGWARAVTTQVGGLVVVAARGYAVASRARHHREHGHLTDLPDVEGIGPPPGAGDDAGL